MPLIIAVVAIIVFFVCMRDNNKEYNRTSANYEKSRRKTNAVREQEVLDGFLRQGMTFAEAYSATQKHMYELGFEPCIPKSAYYGVKESDASSQRTETSCIFDRPVEWYDSDAVKRRREQIKSEGRTPTEEEVYACFPKNNAEYLAELKIRTVKAQAIPVGECFIFPGYGTVEVLSHDLSSASFGKGYYKAKVLRTGEIVRIKIGDNRIRRMGND